MKIVEVADPGPIGVHVSHQVSHVASQHVSQGNLIRSPGKAQDRERVRRRYLTKDVRSSHEH